MRGLIAEYFSRLVLPFSAETTGKRAVGLRMMWSLFGCAAANIALGHRMNDNTQRRGWRGIPRPMLRGSKPFFAAFFHARFSRMPVKSCGRFIGSDISRR